MSDFHQRQSLREAVAEIRYRDSFGFKLYKLCVFCAMLACLYFLHDRNWHHTALQFGAIMFAYWRGLLDGRYR